MSMPYDPNKRFSVEFDFTTRRYATLDKAAAACYSWCKRHGKPRTFEIYLHNGPGALDFELIAWSGHDALDRPFTSFSGKVDCGAIMKIGQPQEKLNEPRETETQD